jgi:hypothetical protein
MDEFDKYAAMLDYINRKTKANFRVLGDNPEDFYGKEDVVLEGEGEKEFMEQDEVGRYEYELAVPFEEGQKKPPYFIEIDETKGRYGYVYTSRLLNVSLRRAYWLIPTSLTVNQVYHGYVSVLTDDKREQVGLDIRKMIEEQARDFEIGKYLITVLKEVGVTEYSYVFGAGVTMPDMGAIFKQYYAGGGQQEIKDIEREKLTREEEEELEEMREMNYIPLSLKTAEDYLILLSY